MKSILIFLVTVFILFAQQIDADIAEEIKGRKIYNVTYMKNPPKGVLAWSQSEMVKKGVNKENRFVAYNSEAAKKLWLDATTDRAYVADPKLKGRETSFYMVYDENGWYIYIESQEPNVLELIESGKGGGSLEIFFVPGLKNTYYHQMIISQPSGKTNFYEWGVPHRFYRSLKNYIEIDSKAIKAGFGTSIFVPWSTVYDRLPLQGDYWRFSFMRWATRVTWGGAVHDTGNFGLIKFKKPSVSVITAIRKKIIRKAWFSFLASAKKEKAFWSDKEMGDIDFYEKRVKPVIDENTKFGKSLGSPESWNAETVEKAWPRVQEWMEFNYVVSDLRKKALSDKIFKDERVK